MISVGETEMILKAAPSLESYAVSSKGASEIALVSLRPQPVMVTRVPREPRSGATEVMLTPTHCALPPVTASATKSRAANTTRREIPIMVMKRASHRRRDPVPAYMFAGGRRKQSNVGKHGRHQKEGWGGELGGGACCNLELEVDQVRCVAGAVGLMEENSQWDSQLPVVSCKGEGDRRTHSDARVVPH